MRKLLQSKAVTFFFNFESMFIKSGDSETRKGLGLKKQQETALGGCFGSLRKKSEKMGPWREVQGVSPDELLLPITPLVARLVGILKV